MDSAAKKTLEEMGKGMGVSAEDLGRIEREGRRQRWRLAIISVIAGVASFILGATVSESISPSKSYPYAAALPLLGISGANRRVNILRVGLVSGAAFTLGYLMMQWQPPEPSTYYGVFGR